MLKQVEVGRASAAVRDPELYFLTLFGTPDAKGTWGSRFEGHHLSVNYTIVDGRGVTAAPTFLGSNPYEVREGGAIGPRLDPKGDGGVLGPVEART